MSEQEACNVRETRLRPVCGRRGLCPSARLTKVGNVGGKQPEMSGGERRLECQAETREMTGKRACNVEDERLGSIRGKLFSLISWQQKHNAQFVLTSNYLLIIIARQ